METNEASILKETIVAWMLHCKNVRFAEAPRTFSKMAWRLGVVLIFML